MNIRQLARFQNYSRASAYSLVKWLNQRTMLVSGRLILFCAKCISFAAYLSGTSLVYARSNKTAQFSYEFTLTEMDIADRDPHMNITSSYFYNLKQSMFGGPAYWPWLYNRRKASAQAN